jgi:hypothetical protein
MAGALSKPDERLPYFKRLFFWLSFFVYDMQYTKNFLMMSLA